MRKAATFLYIFRWATGWPIDKIPHRRSYSLPHAKIYKFDRRWVYVGSLNLDPLAVHWNTEMGLLIDSRDLDSRIYRDFSVDMRPENSWRSKPLRWLFWRNFAAARPPPR